MFEIIQSNEFRDWHHSLRDKLARARITARLRNVEKGNLGDWKPLREGVSELRIDLGPGYQLYFARRAGIIVVLLCGGDKSRQDADLTRAINLAQRWKE